MDEQYISLLNQMDSALSIVPFPTRKLPSKLDFQKAQEWRHALVAEMLIPINKPEPDIIPIRHN